MATIEPGIASNSSHVLQYYLFFPELVTRFRNFRATNNFSEKKLDEHDSYLQNFLLKWIPPHTPDFGKWHIMAIFHPHLDRNTQYREPIP